MGSVPLRWLSNVKDVGVYVCGFRTWSASVDRVVVVVVAMLVVMSTRGVVEGRR